MYNTEKTKKIRINLVLSSEAKMRAKTLAAGMNVSVSHLIEGLIMGVQFVPGKTEVEK